jgi:hypothetical protein
VCGTLLARADEVIERSGHLFEPRLIDNPGEVGFGSSTSFQAQAAHFRFSPDFGHIAASHRSATKSADARRGAAHGGELRQVAGAAASVAPDKQGVTRSQPHISRQSAQIPLSPQFRKSDGHHRTHACSRVDDKKQCEPHQLHWEHSLELQWVISIMAIWKWRRRFALGAN